DGVFIYYANDRSGSFQRWYVEVKDGYVFPDTNHTYKFKIGTTGKYYDVKSLTYPKPANLSTFTGTNTLNMTITPPIGSDMINEGITFLSDFDHYILDFGDKKDASRLSIFKDVSGY